MNENAAVIQTHLLTRFLGREIFASHKGIGSLYRFRVDGEPTHWFYVSYELVSDSAPLVLINLINIHRVAERLNAATQSKWLFMSRDGLYEVDENFAKDR